MRVYGMVLIRAGGIVLSLLLQLLILGGTGGEGTRIRSLVLGLSSKGGGVILNDNTAFRSLQSSSSSSTYSSELKYTEFISAVMFLQPVTEVPRDTASQVFKNVTAQFIQDYAMIQTATSTPTTSLENNNGNNNNSDDSNSNNNNRLIQAVFVDIIVNQQRLFIPAQEPSPHSYPLLSDRLLALEIILDVQVDYYFASADIASGEGGSEANVAEAWVYGAFATPLQQDNFTSQLSSLSSSSSPLEGVETVYLQSSENSTATHTPPAASPPTPPSLDTTADTASSSESSSFNASKIGIIAGAVMLGLALMGLALFFYQQRYYKSLMLDPTSSPPAHHASFQAKRMLDQQSNQYPNHQQYHPDLHDGGPGGMLNGNNGLGYRDLHLDQQEDISTLGESLGGVTSQKLYTTYSKEVPSSQSQSQPQLVDL